MSVPVRIFRLTGAELSYRDDRRTMLQPCESIIGSWMWAHTLRFYHPLPCLKREEPQLIDNLTGLYYVAGLQAILFVEREK